MKVPSGLAWLFALGSIRCVLKQNRLVNPYISTDLGHKPNRDVFARISIRHCECQTPPNKLKDVSDDLIASMLDGTLSWPKDNDTTASCCQSIHTPGEVGRPGDKSEASHPKAEHVDLCVDLGVFQNVCSIQKDLTQGTHNAAFEFLKCCYFDKAMLADCFD